ARPMPTAHTIWELTLHVAAWERVVLRRLQGEMLTLSDEENFGHVGETSEANWQSAIRRLQQTHTELIRSVTALPEKRQRRYRADQFSVSLLEPADRRLTLN